MPDKHQDISFFFMLPSGIMHLALDTNAHPPGAAVLLHSIETPGVGLSLLQVLSANTLAQETH